MNVDFLDKWAQEETIAKDVDCLANGEPLSYNIIENGLILPPPIDINQLGGVCTESMQYIEHTHLHLGQGGVYDYKTFVRDESSAIYLGFFYGVWGHVITDNLKFLWFLHSEEYKRIKREKRPKLVYISSTDFDINKSFANLLALADIDSSEFIKIEKVTQFKEIIVPEPCFFLGEYFRYYTSEYKDLINRITAKVPPVKVDKIYLTRTRLKGQRDFGEKEIEKAFKANGYRIISPERLSLTEQIALYNGANEIATTEGSISHNAIFMTDGSKLTLLRKVNMVNTYQVTINSMRNLEVTYIDAHLSCFVDIKAPWLGPFFLYKNDNVSRFLGCNTDFNGLLFMLYIYRSFRRGNVHQRLLSERELYEKMEKELIRYESPKQQVMAKLKNLFYKTK